MTTARASAARERVIDVATGLFATRGYDGTSTRLIAEAAGINIATLAYHAGGKRDLYLAVMERAHRAERAALETAVAELRATGDLRVLADRYLDLCAANPQIPALWMRRWLSDAADVTDLEARYVRPVFTMVATAVTEVLGAERAGVVDVECLMWTVVWSVHGFGQGGMLDGDGTRRRAADPAALARFRAHLRRLVERQLGLPEEDR